MTPANSHVRFKVLAIAVLLAGITYLDRVCISVTAPQMMQDLALTQKQMSFVFSAFTLAYALFEIPTGMWGDRAGTRRVLTRIVLWWSSFTMITGTVFSYSSLLGARFLFGMGEAGAWPNVARTFSRWFPASERGRAQGIFFMGAHLAGGLTPLLVQALLPYVHWRALFMLFGSVGFLWALAWNRWFRDDPSQHASVSAEELAHITEGRVLAAAHGPGINWRQLLANRTVLGLCLMYFTQTYGFMFYITWLPSYLKSQRGFSAFTLAFLSGLPLTLSVLADLFGGMTTDRLSKRFGLRIGRVAVGGGSLFAAGVFMIAGCLVGDPILAAVLISLAGAASNFLLGAAWGTCIDIGGRNSGALSAAMNTAGQVGGFLSPIILAYLGNYTYALLLTGGLYIGGAFCWLLIDTSRSLDSNGANIAP